MASLNDIDFEVQESEEDKKAQVSRYRFTLWFQESWDAKNPWTEPEWRKPFNLVPLESFPLEEQPLQETISRGGKDFVLQLHEDVKFACYQTEVGKDDKPHIQGYIEFKSQYRWKRAKEWFNNPRVNIGPARGTADQNLHYCLKPHWGTYIQPGYPGCSRLCNAGCNFPDGSPCICNHCEKAKLVRPPWNRTVVGTPGIHNQGKKKRGVDNVAIRAVIDMINAGSTPRDVYEAYPDLYFQKHRNVQAIYDLQPLPESHPVMVTCYWGPSRTYKTTTAERKAQEYMDLHDGQRPFYKRPKTNDGWFDRYHKQKAAVIDEFDYTEMSITQLLVVLDQHPSWLKVKGSFTPWHPEAIWITSQQPPSQWYPDAVPEHRAALMRRFTGGIFECVRDPNALPPQPTPIGRLIIDKTGDVTNVTPEGYSLPHAMFSDITRLTFDVPWSTPLPTTTTSETTTTQTTSGEAIMPAVSSTSQFYGSFF